MNELMRKQINDDYAEILETDAGKRILGGIFHAARLNRPGPKNEYMQGYRDLALAIANTVREVNPHLVADCEIAYTNFIKEFGSNERRDYDTDGGGYDWTD